MDNSTTWNIINTYFEDNPQALVRHHIDSFNDFYKNGIYKIFKEKNPVVLYSKLDPDTNEYMSQCKCIWVVKMDQRFILILLITPVC